MVGIVLVSHSRRLAEGLRELAEQMAQVDVPVAIAAGIDDPDNPIGTDAVQVLAAIEAVYNDDGVVVLMDLGSAILSAETALDFLPPEQQANVHLCPAPFVEGALAAIVQASVGSDVHQVMAEAQAALAAKADQLSTTPSPPQVGAQQAAPPQPAAERTFTIRNPHGLHARPAARFVATANRFAADLRAVKGERVANAKSINQVATLGVRQGEAVRVLASGPDAEAALDALEALVADNFGEAPDQPAPDPATPAVTTPTAAEGIWSGVAASPGFAIGPVFQYRPALPPIEARPAEDPAAEWARLEVAIAAARDELAALERRVARQAGAAEAAIFEAHSLILADPDLAAAVRERLQASGLNAEAVWAAAIDDQAAGYARLEDPYMQARAADVRDAGARVLRRLLALEPPSLALEQPAILVAPDLTPSDTARLEPGRILGICTELGGATAHSAILARALGIPAVVGLGPRLASLPEGGVVALDGGKGWLWPAPDDDTRARLERERDAWQRRQADARRAAQAPAVTADGRRVEVAANIGGPPDVAVALDYGAEGVGLFRTEFLFLDRQTAPSEAEQVAAYRQVAETMAGRPVIVRTLDVGGDKPLPYLDLGDEENPFLGWRGIRFCLDMPEVIRPQLRAILRASAHGRLKLMFPMISSLAELRRARAILAEVQAELREEGEPFDETMEVGIMIEVPSAVAVADQLAREVDFFSIGTNDLTQYAMAADRGNPRVAGLVDALQPAVLRLVRQTVEAGHAAGIWVGMCGELAGDALAAPLLIGLGLDELSMSAPAIPAVKAALRALDSAGAIAIADHALSLDTAAAVRAVLASLTPG